MDSLLDRPGEKLYPWGMDPLPDYETLAGLEPRIKDMERRARAVEDDGSGAFFCSNYLWLPMYTELRDVIGAQRKRVDGEAKEGVLFDSYAFERVYLVLSKLLPACRDCGCRKFQRVLHASGQR